MFGLQMRSTWSIFATGYLRKGVILEQSNPLWHLQRYMNSPNVETKNVSFNEFDLPQRVLKGIESAGFTHCTPIQALSLPITLKGDDIAAQAQTGTGKTAAFLITIIARLIRNPEPKDAGPRALIVAPTRELTVQICEEAKLL